MIWNEQRILQTGTCFSSTANLWCFHHRYRRPPSGHLWDSRRADGCWVEGHGCHRGQVAVPHPGLGVSKKKNVFIMCKSTFCNFFDNMYIDYIYIHIDIIYVYELWYFFLWSFFIIFFAVLIFWLRSYFTKDLSQEFSSATQLQVDGTQDARRYKYLSITSWRSKFNKANPLFFLFALYKFQPF